VLLLQKRLFLKRSIQILPPVLSANRQRGLQDMHPCHPPSRHPPVTMYEFRDKVRAKWFQMTPDAEERLLVRAVSETAGAVTEVGFRVNGYYGSNFRIQGVSRSLRIPDFLF